MAKTLHEAQEDVRAFAQRNGWQDKPNLDTIDHLHEELVEVSQHLRYKTADDMLAYVEAHRDLFTAEMGDVIFAACRLANQLGVDLEEAFRASHKKALTKYTAGTENNIPWKTA